jgi:hypothetical protein
VVLLTWRWFVGATTLAVGILLKVGAPIVCIVGGIIIAAAMTWRYGGRQ